MGRSADTTDPIRRKAAAFPAVDKGTSCSQSAFKAGKRSFLYIGPGAKGKGFKAMFKLDRSMPEARKLAATDPDHYEVGATGWVTARFTAEAPLSRNLWERWLKESYELSLNTGSKRK